MGSRVLDCAQRTRTASPPARKQIREVCLVTSYGSAVLLIMLHKSLSMTFVPADNHYVPPLTYNPIPGGS